jgi:hypothetical protein
MLLDFKYDRALQLADENEEKPLRLKFVGDQFFSRYYKSHKNADFCTKQLSCRQIYPR